MRFTEIYRVLAKLHFSHFPACALQGSARSQVLSGETRFLRIRAYPEKIGAAARFWSISAHYRTVQYILYFSTFVLLLLLLFYGTPVKFQMLNLSKFVSLAFKFQIFDLSKFVSLAVKFQIFDLSKFVSLAYCCKMQAHSTMMIMNMANLCSPHRHWSSGRGIVIMIGSSANG